MGHKVRGGNCGDCRGSVGGDTSKPILSFGVAQQGIKESMEGVQASMDSHLQYREKAFHQAGTNL